MNGIYAGWESLNAGRRYPFSESCAMLDSKGVPLDDGVFSDASVYPVVYGELPDGIEPPGLVLMDPPSGEVRLSFNGGELVGRCSAESRTIDLEDGDGRPCGCLVTGPGWASEFGSMRARRFSGAFLAPSAFMPVSIPWVAGFEDPSGARTSRMDVSFVGDGSIRPRLSDGPDGTVLSFDATYDRDEPFGGVVRQLVVACVGDTLFDVSVDQAMPDGTAYVSTPVMDREDVCWHAHAEDSVSVVVDTCESTETCRSDPIPEKDESVELCPSESGDITLTTYVHMTDGPKNPLKIDPVMGRGVQNTMRSSEGMSIEELQNEASVLTSRAGSTGNGIVIGFPGLSGGV